LAFRVARDPLRISAEMRGALFLCWLVRVQLDAVAERFFNVVKIGLQFTCVFQIAATFCISNQVYNGGEITLSIPAANLALLFAHTLQFFKRVPHNSQRNTPVKKIGVGWAARLSTSAQLIGAAVTGFFALRTGTF